MNRMKVVLGKGDLRAAECDALGLFFVEGKTSFSLVARAADRLTGGALSRAVERGFKGKKDEVERITGGKSSPFGQAVMVGLGPREKLEVENFRRAGGLLIGALEKGQKLSVHVEMRDPFRSGLSLPEITQAVVEGAILRNYRYLEYKTKEARPGPVSLLALYGDSHALSRGIEKGVVSAGAQCWARDLINRPSAALTPELFVRECGRVAREHSLSVGVWREAELRRAGMNAILAVGRGSHHPPRLVEVVYRGRKTRELDLVLVGKGITFDSGGISIKPGEKMDEMKGDMSGAAEVLAAVSAAARLKLKINAAAVLALAENMPGGGAQRPGDIIRTASGLTVEVKNTDAEGRLVLADAFHYARGLKPRLGIIDVATLTGACTVALGTQAIALMGNDEELAGKVEAAGQAAGERTWRLPLWEEYEELIESQVADMINTSTRSREAGTIVGGIFLKKFVGDIPWAHLDIASVAWLPKAGPYLSAGPSAKGTRLLIRLLEAVADPKFRAGSREGRG